MLAKSIATGNFQIISFKLISKLMADLRLSYATNSFKTITEYLL